MWPSGSSKYTARPPRHVLISPYRCPKGLPWPPGAGCPGPRHQLATGPSWRSSARRRPDRRARAPRSHGTARAAAAAPTAAAATAANGTEATMATDPHQPLLPADPVDELRTQVGTHSAQLDPLGETVTGHADLLTRLQEDLKLLQRDNGVTATSRFPPHAGTTCEAKTARRPSAGSGTGSTASTNRCMGTSRPVWAPAGPRAPARPGSPRSPVRDLGRPVRPGHPAPARAGAAAGIPLAPCPRRAAFLSSSLSVTRVSCSDQRPQMSTMSVSFRNKTGSQSAPKTGHLNARRPGRHLGRTS
jgi:hypothetical protein